MSNIPPPPPASPPPPPMGTPGMPSGSGVPSGPVTPVDNGLRFGCFLLEMLLTIVTCGIGWLIWSVVVWKESTTPAKKLMKLKVVDVSTGAPATMNQMVMRELVGKIAISLVGNVVTASILSNSGANIGAILYLVSGIMIIATATRQGVWDYIAKTTVVRAG